MFIMTSIYYVKSTLTIIVPIKTYMIKFTLGHKINFRILINMLHYVTGK